MSTTSDGAPLGPPAAGTTSDHTFVFAGGSGEVDAAAGTARISWSGSVSVLYYSGMSAFVVSDPVLEVAGGRGELRASVGGHASSQTDQTVWQEVPAQVVTLATLPAVDLSDPRGFTATPAYLGVTVSGVPQVTGTPSSGSFPQSFVDQLDRLGAAAFWYSSGTSTDPFKVALPLTVGLDAAGGPPAAPPTSAPATRPPSVQNSAPVRPSSSTPDPTPTPSASATPTAASQPQPVAVPPLAAPTAADPVPEDAAAGALLAQPPTATRVAPVAAVIPATPASDPWPWWLGSALLLLAAASLLVPPRSARRR
nr:HtaA domain-containing protein [Nocardioides flavescens]